MIRYMKKTKELKMIAEVIINSNVKSLNKTFDYAVPARLETAVKVGTRVCVPFGNSKKAQDRVCDWIKGNYKL